MGTQINLNDPVTVYSGHDTIKRSYLLLPKAALIKTKQRIRRQINFVFFLYEQMNMRHFEPGFLF